MPRFRERKAARNRESPSVFQVESTGLNKECRFDRVFGSNVVSMLFKVFGSNIVQINQYREGVVLHVVSGFWVNCSFVLDSTHSFCLNTSLLGFLMYENFH